MHKRQSLKTLHTFQWAVIKSDVRDNSQVSENSGRYEAIMKPV